MRRRKLKEDELRGGGVERWAWRRWRRRMRSEEVKEMRGRRAQGRRRQRMRSEKVERMGGGGVDALNSLKSEWEIVPPNWNGSDPCGDHWDGIKCFDSHVVSIKLSSMSLSGRLSGGIDGLSWLNTLDLSNNIGLKGTLPSSIGKLKKLRILMLVGCSFSGPIPDSIGSLPRLVYLSLASNSFNGSIPHSIGNLSMLSWLDLSDNELTGTIPVSNHMQPGLDQLFSAENFHLAKNQLSGTIPPKFFNPYMMLKHVILDHNQLSGEIPQTLGLVKTLEVVRLDSNLLNGSIPDNLNNLMNLHELYLSNNILTGPIPNLIGMDYLYYLYMVNTNLKGQIPADVLSLPQLETMLSGNPICRGNKATEKYCIVQKNNSTLLSLNYCSAAQDCDSGKIQSPTCMCSHPQTGTLHFFSYSFSNFENWTYYITLDNSLESAFISSGLPVDSVSVTDPAIDVYSYLQFRVKVFPYAKDTFNRSEVSDIGFLFNYQDFPLQQYGPYLYIADDYCCFGGANKSSHTDTSIIVGVSVVASVLFLLIVCSTIYAFLQRSRAKRATKKSNPFASWDGDKSGSTPQLKGVRWFSFEMIRKCTDNFSDTNCIGSGGYGKVYRGLLAPGELVAIKRAQQGSLQGALEFKTEIELLSRIYHKNVVNLVGFCYEQGEQMLVYEYIPNGTLRESLSDDESNSRKLDKVIDEILTPCTNLKGVQKFINLAMNCVRESAAERPSMGQVVREIENIIQMAEEFLFIRSEFLMSSGELPTEEGYRVIVLVQDGTNSNTRSITFDDERL
nr:probable leucine-rich repeat receptor-like protein kinase At5g49770 [Ipomoea batatas]